MKDENGQEVHDIEFGQIVVIVVGSVLSIIFGLIICYALGFIK